MSFNESINHDVFFGQSAYSAALGLRIFRPLRRGGGFVQRSGGGAAPAQERAFYTTRPRTVGPSVPAEGRYIAPRPVPAAQSMPQRRKRVKEHIQQPVVAPEDEPRPVETVHEEPSEMEGLGELDEVSIVPERPIRELGRIRLSQEIRIEPELYAKKTSPWVYGGIAAALVGIVVVAAVS